MPMPQMPQPQTPQTSEQVGAVPQGQMPAPGGKPGSLSPQDLDYLRNGDPEVKQVFSLFIGKPVDLNKVPDEIITQVAGMVHKLGPQGAVAMLNKMIPPQVKQKMIAEVG